MPPRRRTTDQHLPQCVYRKHGAYWYVKCNQWTRLGSDLTSALAAYARLIDAPLDGLPALLERTLADAAERVRPSTLAQYQVAARKLDAVFAEFGPSQVEPRHVARMMDHYRAQPAMANRLRTVLKLTFDTAVRAGLVTANPVTPIAPHRTRRRTRYLTDTEYRAIHATASPVLRAIMDLAYLTAQRISDVLAIRLQDLTAEGIEIDQSKTSKRLTLIWTPDLREAVAGAKAQLPRSRIVRLGEPAYLLGQRNGKIRSYRGVKDVWDRACTRAGVEDAHLHDLRAKSLTDAKRQGLDAQRLAGHSTEAQTVRYLRGRERDLVTGPCFRQPSPVLDIGCVSD